MGGTVTGTVEVIVPTPVYVTITISTGTSSVYTTTLNTADPFNTVTGTVEIVDPVPVSQVTVFTTGGTRAFTSILTPTTTEVTISGTSPVIITVNAPPTASGGVSSVSQPTGPQTVLVNVPTSVAPVAVVTTTTTTTFEPVGSAPFTTTQPTLGGTVTVVQGTPLHITTITLTSGTQAIVTSTLVQPSGTRTGTVAIIYPTPQTCNNQGLQYAVYVNPFQIDSGTGATTNYTSFSPEYFKTQRPYAIDTTTVLGFVNDIPGDNDANGNPTYDTNITLYKTNTKTIQIAVNHRGYFYAQQSGTYTFRTPASDDITIFWFGDLAYSGWTRGNADIVQPYTRPQLNAVTVTRTLIQGQYYPFRIVFGNGVQVARFYFEVFAPDGSLIVSNSTSGTKYLVQYACDQDLAPQFQPFGQET